MHSLNLFASTSVWTVYATASSSPGRSLRIPSQIWRIFCVDGKRGVAGGCVCGCIVYCVLHTFGSSEVEFNSLNRRPASSFFWAAKDWLPFDIVGLAL